MKSHKKELITTISHDCSGSSVGTSMVYVSTDADGEMMFRCECGVRVWAKIELK